jgi:hypothetical protein
MWKMFRFPLDDTSSNQKNFRILDKLFSYKTIECFDEPVTKNVAIACDRTWCQTFRGWEKLGRLAKQSSQLVRGEQLVVRIFFDENIKDYLIGELALQMWGKCSEGGALRTSEAHRAVQAIYRRHFTDMVMLSR